MTKVSDWARQLRSQELKYFVPKPGEYLITVDDTEVPQIKSDDKGHKFWDFRIEYKKVDYIFHQKESTSICRALIKYLSKDIYHFKLSVIAQPGNKLWLNIVPSEYQPKDEEEEDEEK